MTDTAICRVILSKTGYCSSDKGQSLAALHKSRKLQESVVGLLVLISARRQVNARGTEVWTSTVVGEAFVDTHVPIPSDFLLAIVADSSPDHYP